jgi:hypothetical protein
VLPRVLGFGWQQTDALAALAQTPRAQRGEVANLGALLNLGITLFDLVLDRHPERAAVLLDRVTPEFLEKMLSDPGDGSSASAQGSGDAGIDLLVCLIEEFFLRSARLGGERREQLLLAKLIRDMYRAERFVSATRRDKLLPDREVWRELRCKSAMPMETMAQLALLPPPYGDATSRVAAQRCARLAGLTLWIADALADVREDWNAGCWSRPLWLLARRFKRGAADAESSLRHVATSGIAADEVERLRINLTRLRELSSSEQEFSFLRCVQATLHSWIESMPT